MSASPLYSIHDEFGSPVSTIFPEFTTDICVSPRILSASPQLEIKDLGVHPFSNSFSGLFDFDADGEISHIKDVVHHRLGEDDQSVSEIAPDMSYNIQHFTDIKDIDPEWEHDEIEEIVVMKRKPKLPRIPEAMAQSRQESVSLPISFTSFEMLHSLRDPNTTCRKSTITLGRHRVTSKLYTLKGVASTSETERRDARLERHILETLQLLNCPSLPRLRWSFEHVDRFYFVTDFYPGNDLLTRITSSGRLSVQRSQAYACELAAAIAVLHGAGIIHGDLSPQNIFFNEDGRLVVTNFGASTIHQSTMLRPVQLVPPSEYQAPEVHLGWTQHFAVDCWGFGILLYMMLFGSCPFSKQGDRRDLKAIRDSVLFGVARFEGGNDLAVDASPIDLLAKCLERNPVMRPTIQEIQSHDFLLYKNDSRPSTLCALCRPTSIIHHHGNFSTCEIGLDWGSPAPSTRSRDPGAVPFGHFTAPAETCLDFPLAPADLNSNALLIEKVKEAQLPEQKQGEERSMPTTHIANAAEAQAARDQFWETISLQADSGSSGHTLKASDDSQTSRKLRKRRSCMAPLRIFASLADTSVNTTKKKLGKKLRRPESTPVLSARLRPQGRPLPNGVQQIGKGIGFTYGDDVPPPAARSRVSICTTTTTAVPSTCHHAMLRNVLGMSLSFRGARRRLGFLRPARSPEEEDATTRAVYGEGSWDVAGHSDVNITLPFSLTTGLVPSPATGKFVEKCDPTTAAHDGPGAPAVSTTLRLVSSDGDDQTGSAARAF